MLSLEQIIENVLGYIDSDAETNDTLLRNPFTIMGPNGNGNKEKLRIYAYGARVGNIEVNTKGLTCQLFDKKYIENHLEDLNESDKTLTEKWRKDNTAKKGTYICGAWCREVIGTEDYLRLALQAAKHKFHKKKKNENKEFYEKERNIQTQIIREYMKSDTSWSIVDAETGITKDWVKKSYVIKNVKKPDFIVFDNNRKEFGIVELKYMNDSTTNLKEHYDLFYEVYQQPQVFVKKLSYRMQVLAKYNLLKKEYGDVEISEKVWFGFLFVAGGREGAVKIVKNHMDDIVVSKACRFLYVDGIEELKMCGLQYDEMMAYEDFTNV